VREFLEPVDRRLNLYSREVLKNELSSSLIRGVLDDMHRIASGERDEAHPNRRTLVGLAAPQIGELLRIILIDTAADPTTPNYKPNLEFFINPRIINASLEDSPMREGCYSTGVICGAVIRSDEVTIAGLNVKGEEIEFKSHNAFQSHIIQHEIDHLNGVRFPSRVRDQRHLHLVEEDEFQAYRENWTNWKKYYPFEKWLEMYMGQCDAEI